jgi:hypothetical protein
MHYNRKSCTETYVPMCVWSSTPGEAEARAVELYPTTADFAVVTDNFAWANSPAKLIVDACTREMASFNDLRICW